MNRLLRKSSRLGKYRLERRLGRGAVAEVWRARDTIEGIRVALKVAHPEAIEQFGREAIEHEARIAARLSHRNLLALRNADWIDGRFVLATELARVNLARYAGVRRSAAVALRVIREVAAGLAHAHAQRVMHRDVKPENILILPDGRAVLADFGEWRFAPEFTRPLTDAGTFGYVAPEQAYGRPALASDVFSLGLIAYEILTGVLPRWPFDWPPERYARFRARVPEPIRAVLRKAAEFEPERRYADAVELHRALERAFRRVEERAQRTRPRPKRRALPREGSPRAAEAEWFRRQHGRRLELRFRCHRCEGPISEAMAHCPWCGSSDNSLLEHSAFPLVCPECERGVRPEWTYCPWCFAGRFVADGRRPPPDPRASRRCATPRCDGQLRPFMRYCPRCKAKPRRPWLDPELPDRCPRCRWSVDAKVWRFCPWCGRQEPRAGRFSAARAR